MLVSSFDTLINSTPGVMIAGAGLAGIVWKFFDAAEGVANEDTKRQIGHSLLGLNVATVWESALQTYIHAISGESVRSLRRLIVAAITALVGLAFAYRPLAKAYYDATARPIPIGSLVL